jgi:hypothetical protein
VVYSALRSRFEWMRTRNMRLSYLAGITMLGVIPTAGCVPEQLDAGPVARIEAATAPVSLTRPQPPADGLPQPDWRIGDSWRYSDGYAIQVVERLNGLTKFERLDDPRQWFVNLGLLRERSQSSSTLREQVFRSEDPERLYSTSALSPIVFIREYLRNGVLVRHRTSWLREGTERITVPAGTFDAQILTMRTRSLTGNWTGYERWWYSPQVRNYVRMEYKYGEAPESARVLVSYDLK